MWEWTPPGLRRPRRWTSPPPSRARSKAVREADCLARSLERRVGKPRPKPVEDRRPRQLHGVTRPWWRATPAVEDDQRYERIRAAISQIASKDSSSREAPPTRAP